MTHNKPLQQQEPASAKQMVNFQASTEQDGLTSPSLTQAIAPADVTISTEKRPAKQRRILASVEIPQPVDKVWQVITDYDHLADFIPSLTTSKVISQTDGRIRLEQIGAQCFLKIKFCARVVLEMTESFPHKVGFSMQEGDFKQFEGAWHLQPTENQQATLLSYDLFVKPPKAMPIALIERHIRHNLTTNLLAIHQRTLALATQ
ncbi:MAG: SRPBCC family protein [Cyanobacteria bacterium P01_D01_bin.36]